MKKVNVEEMITKKQKELIICGKKLKCDLKAMYSDDEHKFSADELERLIALSKNNPEEYISELIDLNFKDDLINREAIGTSYLLPSRFERFYKDCVLFAGGKYKIYFVDDAIKHLSDKIDKLKLRRIEDSRTYAFKMIETGKVENLKFRFSNSFSWNKETYCLYDDNNEYYCMETEPKHILYYKIALDDEKKTNPADTKNMIDILDKFVLVHGPIKHISSSSKELVASSYDYIDGIIRIDGLDSAPRELVQKIYSLKRSDK